MNWLSDHFSPYITRIAGMSRMADIAVIVSVSVCAARQKHSWTWTRRRGLSTRPSIGCQLEWNTRWPSTHFSVLDFRQINKALHMHATGRAGKVSQTIQVRYLINDLRWWSVCQWRQHFNEMPWHWRHQPGCTLLVRRWRSYMSVDGHPTQIFLDQNPLECVEFPVIKIWQSDLEVDIRARLGKAGSVFQRISRI